MPTPYTRQRDGKVAVCPECGVPVVWDSGLWHCDTNGHGAWDHASWVDPADVPASEPEHAELADGEPVWQDDDGTWKDQNGFALLPDEVAELTTEEA